MYATLMPSFFQLLRNEVVYYEKMKEMQESIKVSNRTKMQVSQKRYVEAPKVNKYHRQQNK